MNYRSSHTAWFTLVELLVSVTIFGIIMVAVISIFIFGSQMSTRVEMERLMQENIKNFVEDIVEWVRKNGIESVTDFWNSCPQNVTTTPTIRSKTWACLNNGSSYVLGRKTTGSTWERVSNTDDCKNSKTSKITCHILKKESTGNYYPLTNSFSNFQALEFTYIPWDIPRLAIHFIAHPAYGKWLSPSMIERATTAFQTTVSERIISTK